MIRTFSYLFIFVGLQLFFGAAMNYVWDQIAGTSDVSTVKLIVTSALTSVATIAVFLWPRWAEVSPAWLRTRPWAVLLWSVVAALGAIIPSTWLQEQLPALPNFVEVEFDMILQDRWGYLVIGLLAPLCEEIVFRGAILRQLLAEPRLSAWGAIALSALLFSLVHMNPAQIPHAFAVGLLLGWMYWRTGSILPGMAFHWANNSVAYVLYNLYPVSDLKLIDLFRGSQLHVWLAVVFSLLILLPALFQLHQWMRRVPSEINNQKI